MARALLLLLAACGSGAPTPPIVGDDAAGAALVCPASAYVDVLPVSFGAVDTPAVDDDLDGASELEGDCDDRDRFVGERRTARETCDLRDNDCDGVVDEDACVALSCPLPYPHVRCCGLTHTIGGVFSAFWMPDGVPTGDWDYGNPWAVVLRRRDTGEMRLAPSCASPPRTAAGYQYRFLLEDEDFVVANAAYDVLLDMRTAFPAVTRCSVKLPVITTDANAAACGNVGQARAICRPR